jgi:hypothetical protein
MSPVAILVLLMVTVPDANVPVPLKSVAAPPLIAKN